MKQNGSVEVAVIGGGLGGLAAAALLARAGRSVALYEKASEVGGRALTHEADGFKFNLGPHALYNRGEGRQVLDQLGVSFTGKMPSVSGAYGVDRGAKHALPGGLLSLLTTSLLRLPAKLETARLLATFQKIEPSPLQGITVRDWLQQAIRHEEVRSLVRALFRLSTYANDPNRQSAGSAIDQLQKALSANVTYIDGGWQVLTDGLRRAAEKSGVRMSTSSRVVAVERDGDVRAVRLEDGTVQVAGAVVIAASPAVARSLVDVPELRQWEEESVPVQAACLDLALKRLPRARATFALGIDRPLYLSVHSAYARLAPEGAATIQVAKYLDPNQPNEPRADEQELEALLDLIQAGWRDLVVDRRFLPRMVVANALPLASRGGVPKRPGPTVPGIRNLYVVGDWVGPEGMLADASLASARRVAEKIASSHPIRAAA